MAFGACEHGAMGADAERGSVSGDIVRAQRSPGCAQLCATSSGARSAAISMTSSIRRGRRARRARPPRGCEFAGESDLCGRAGNEAARCAPRARGRRNLRPRALNAAWPAHARAERSALRRRLPAAAPRSATPPIIKAPRGRGCSDPSPSPTTASIRMLTIPWRCSRGLQPHLARAALERLARSLTAMPRTHRAAASRKPGALPRRYSPGTH